MKATGEMKQKFMYVLMMAALMFAFGTRAAAATPQTLFTSQVPGQTGQSDGANVNYELGNQFRSNTAGQVTAIRFWKDANERGTHTGNIWSANGALLASVKFTNESAAGWQQQILASPLSIVRKMVVSGSSSPRTSTCKPSSLRQTRDPSAGRA